MTTTPPLAIRLDVDDLTSAAAALLGESIEARNLGKSARAADLAEQSERLSTAARIMRGLTDGTTLWHDLACPLCGHDLDAGTFDTTEPDEPEPSDFNPQDWTDDDPIDLEHYA